MFALPWSMWRNDGKVDIFDLINGVLGSLVGITAGCFLYTAWESILVGLIGGVFALTTPQLFDRMGVDDPVGASSVHGKFSTDDVILNALLTAGPHKVTRMNY